MKKVLKRLIFLSTLLLVLSTACSDHDNDLIIDPERPPRPSADSELSVNGFIAYYMQDAYLWTSTIDWSTIHPEDEPDPYKFFNQLKYDTEDKWSTLTDNIAGLTGEFDGISTSFGYQLIFAYDSESPEYLIGIVLFVYPDSPAEKAGLKRGDFILSKDFAYITESDYMDLYNAPALLLQTASYDIETNEMSYGFVYLMAESMYQDPVNTSKIIDKGSDKIGYLCYTDYMIDSESRLQEVFTEFKSQGVTDIVIDLRYNSGGYARTSCILSSILAPAAVVKNKEVYVSQQWNDAYMAYFRKSKYDTNEYFTDTLAVNMDLNRLFVLTSEFTASASESTIIGLNPYMDIIQIGGTTHGKYCGGVLLSPEVWDYQNEVWLPVEEISNWGLYLMVYRFANKNGITSFTGGLEPDIKVEEDYGLLYPFGDERDPLLAEAISMITGESQNEKRSAFPESPFKLEKIIRPVKALDGKRIDSRPLPRIKMEE